MGLRVPADPYQAKRFLDNQLPWVGTIHSLAYKLIGRPPMVKLPEFIADMGGHTKGPSMSVDDLEGYAWAEPGRSEVEAALAIHSAARNRMVPVEVAYNLVPWGFQGPTISIERAQKIIAQYEEYKKGTARIDFDDMLSLALMEGAHPPVNVVLSDEVQDNSPLLWKVGDQWARDVDYYAMAGDPYQAIYLFSGAEPDLFIKHPATWCRYDSRRLTSRGSQRAQGHPAQRGVRGKARARHLTASGTGQARAMAAKVPPCRTARLLDDVMTCWRSRIAYDRLRAQGPRAPRLPRRSTSCSACAAPGLLLTASLRTW